MCASLASGAMASTGFDERFGAPRSKTISWHDPLAVAAAGAQLSGLDYLRAILDGELPPAPIAAHFGLRPVAVEVGSVEFVASPDESAYNPIGLIHGGMVSTLLDTAAGCAVHTTLPAGAGYASIEMKVNFLRPVHGDSGDLTVRGWVTKPGRRVAFAQGQVLDAAGKVLADCTSSCAITAAPMS